MSIKSTSGVRNLVLVLGDQLDRNAAAFDGFDPRADAVWMAEVPQEAEHVWSHKARIAVFLSAMRHFAQELRDEGTHLHYRRLDDEENRGDFGAELLGAMERLRPRGLVVVAPGEWRVETALRAAADTAGVSLHVRPDRHFICTDEEFAAHAEGRKQLRMEHFYRAMRRRTGWLMEGDKPVGGRWNFDVDNRRSFGAEGPGDLPRPLGFPPDATTREVLRLVEARCGSHPGSLAEFDWPVTRAQAHAALEEFVGSRLDLFGPYEDAMWAGEPHVYHSRLSCAANLKLLDPRDAIRAADEALAAGMARLQSVEAFIRQFLGWREYVRGIYRRFMPEYERSNAFGAHLPLPGFYWSGETDMNCLREVIGQTLRLGYAHHIQRLMVTGNFALLLGVDPREVHRWYLAIYVDAVEWVEMPNVLGMSQFADGGLMASKPYLSTGKYIRRMSNYCEGCRYRPEDATGERACPFTTLYWDFLLRHEDMLRGNPRMSLQVRNTARLSGADREAIRSHAAALRARWTE